MWPIAAVLAVAIALRVYGLERHSLSLDEAVCWWNATRPTWRAAAFAEPNHAPLWWWITRAFVLAFGDREAVLRAPAALAGIAAVALAWRLAGRVLDPARAVVRAGFRGIDAGAPTWVAAFAAVNPFWLEYSQEARMYSTLLAGSLGLSLLLLSWLERRRGVTLAAYAFLAAALLYVHVFAGLTLLAHAAFMLLRGRAAPTPGVRAPLVPLLGAQAAAVLAFAPWAARSLGSGVEVASFGRFGAVQRLAFALWRLAYGPTWAALDRPRIDAGAVALIRAEWPALAVGGALAIAAALSFVWAMRRDPVARDFVLTLAAVPALVLLAAFSRLPLLHEKYLIGVAPAVAMVLVVGARAAPWIGRVLGVALAAFVALGAVAFVAPMNPIAARLVVRGHPYGKEDWRAAHAWVATHAGPHDVTLIQPTFCRIPWDYYDRGRLPVATLGTEAPARADFAAALAGHADAERVFLVTGSNPAPLRERMIADLAAWTSPPGAPAATAPRARVLFPAQWGVWACEFPPPLAGTTRGAQAR
ncbi:MAG TPA: glycosyltransferase family 39 protein [Candidatus Saccharimonadaceae bacterium]|nr:glycosyltransferase family 39 protein [Candidatus Saccharimonadaceae bacterium]